MLDPGLTLSTADSQDSASFVSTWLLQSHEYIRIHTSSFLLKRTTCRCQKLKKEV